MVIWVVGAQKLVPTLADGIRRIEEYAYLFENQRMVELTGRQSQISQILIVQGSLNPYGSRW